MAVVQEPVYFVFPGVKRCICTSLREVEAALHNESLSEWQTQTIAGTIQNPRQPNTAIELPVLIFRPFLDALNTWEREQRRAHLLNRLPKHIKDPRTPSQQDLNIMRDEYGSSAMGVLKSGPDQVVGLVVMRASKMVDNAAMAKAEAINAIAKIDHLLAHDSMMRHPRTWREKTERQKRLDERKALQALVKVCDRVETLSKAEFLK